MGDRQEERGPWEPWSSPDGNPTSAISLSSSSTLVYWLKMYYHQNSAPNRSTLDQLWSQRTSKSSYYFIILAEPPQLAQATLMSVRYPGYLLMLKSIHLFSNPAALKQNNNLMLFSSITIFSRTFFQVTVNFGKRSVFCFAIFFMFFPYPQPDFFTSLSQFLSGPQPFCVTCMVTSDRWPRKHKGAENNVEH